MTRDKDITELVPLGDGAPVGTTALYRVTTAEAAKEILAGGFRDARESYLADQELVGVWLTDDPIGCVSGGGVWNGTDTILRVVLNVELGALLEFESNERPGEPVAVRVNYREWLIPAARLNTLVRTIGRVEDNDEATARLKAERVPSPPIDGLASE